jgi:hypothetical protein
VWTKAAVMRQSAANFEITEPELDPLRPGAGKKICGVLTRPLRRKATWSDTDRQATRLTYSDESLRLAGRSSSAESAVDHKERNA